MLTIGLEIPEIILDTGFHTPPPLKGKMAMDTLTPSPATVVYKISVPMGDGMLIHHWL